MIFSEEFLSELKDDPLTGTIRLIDLVHCNLPETSHEWDDEDYSILLEAYALILEIIDSNLLALDSPTFTISGELQKDGYAIYRYLTELHDSCTIQSSKLKIEAFRGHFKTALGSHFSYEFSQGDLERVQELVNEIRGLISNTHGLEMDHQRRLLARLEKLQAEMHKKVSDLDRFWGLIGDAGVVLGKLGKDAKPIVDRIREVANIVWQTQSRAEELPSGTQPPMLDSKENSNAPAQ